MGAGRSCAGGSESSLEHPVAIRRIKARVHRCRIIVFWFKVLFTISIPFVLIGLQALADLT